MEPRVLEAKEHLKKILIKILRNGVPKENCDAYDTMRFRIDYFDIYLSVMGKREFCLDARPDECLTEFLEEINSHFVEAPTVIFSGITPECAMVLNEETLAKMFWEKLAERFDQIKDFQKKYDKWCFDNNAAFISFSSSIDEFLPEGMRYVGVTKKVYENGQ